MSELSKNQLTTENNNSFPNNNTGYITPTLLRTFNQNMIDSLVDEIQYNVDSASFNQRINLLDPSGSAQAINALEVASASLNAYTASQNSFNSSATASIVALQNFSSSLDTTYATDAQLSASVSALSSSVTVTTNGLSSSIGILDSEVNALQSWSSSLDTIYATDAQLSASASTLQNNINTLSQSVAVTDLAQSQSIAALQQFSSSLDSTFATDAQLSASASTLQNNINAKLDSASFNTYTQSNDSKVNSLINATGSYATLTQLSASASTLQTNIDGVSAQLNSYSASTNFQLAQIQQRVSASATTGSNTFIGNQIVSGNVNIAGNITAISASFTYITTVFETASVIFSSGSNQLGDELSDVQTLSGSVRVQGDLTVNGVPVQTASFDASGYLLTSSFNQYTESAASGVSASINSATQSLSSSIAVTTNNLDLEVNEKLDSSSFNSYTQSNDTKVNSLIAQTGSYAISSSVANTFDAFSSSISLTYATETELSASASTLQNGINSKVENSTFNTYTSSQNTINQGLQTGITIRLLTSSFNSYTSSNDSKVNSLIAATGSYITSAQTSSMTVLSASYSETASFALNVTPTDVTPFLSKSVFDAYTGSAALGVSESINSATQSLSSSIAVTTNNLDLEVNGKLDSSSFNSYTQSNNSVVNALVAATSSYVTEAETGSFITSAQTSSMSVLSASFAVTAAFAENVTPTDVSMFVSQSTFNAYTQSNNSVVNALVSATSSYVTESETGSFARVNVSNVFTQNQTISGNLDVTGKITALSASITYLETIYQTSSVVYSSGSNILGDELSDTQTLSGSVLVQGLLRVNGVAPILVGETASYASASISSSYALTASFALSSSNTISSSFAQTSSEARNVVIIARNGNASSLPAGTIVHITGASGDNPIFNTASYDSEALSSNTLGMLRTTATSGADVEVLVNGIVVGVDTDPANGFVAGDVLYLGPTGSFTRVQPQAPNQIVTIGQVLRAQQNNGSIYVSINNGWELNELHNVAINNPTEGDLLVYRSGSYGLWTNSSSAELGLINTSSFNSYTQSNDSRVDSLIAKTGSYATTASNTFIGNQIISGNLLVTGSNINLEVDAPALSIGTTNVKTILDATASGVVSSTDITRLGAGPTGDLSAIRIQTLSGSDTSGDTLLSRVTTGVNRHTSTGMTGSVVNTQMVSTWATGSAGTRVAYSTQIVANAQSQSATLTLSAGNLSSNNAGGTASIAAGLIRIGTNASHTISSTGSFGPMVLVGPLNQPVFSLRSGSFEVTTPQGSGSFYTNLPITSSAGRINGDLIVTNNITASVISASTYIGVGFANSSSFATTASYALNVPTNTATTGSNTFKDTQTIDLIATSSTTAISILGNATEVVTDMYVNGGNFDTFNVSVSASNGIQLRDWDGANLKPFISVDTNGGNVRIPRNTNITGSLNVSASQTGDDGNIIRGGLTIVGDNLGNGVGIKSGSFALTTPQGAGFFYSNLPITSSALRINGTALVADLIVSGVFGGNSSLQVNANASVTQSLWVGNSITASVISASTYIGIPTISTGSLATTGSNTFKGVQIISSSVRGEQYVGSVASSTASFDCSTGNFFTLVLGSGANHISASNIRQGQTINVRVTTQTGNTANFSTAIKQPSGSSYTPTNAAGTDILTFVSFDTTLFMVSAKNFI